jgi:Ornithine cyclodeaminase/mu-crystallin family
MAVLLTRGDLRPLFEESRWIEESLQLCADALMATHHGVMSWLLFPVASEDQFVNVQVESAPVMGTYLRVFPDRCLPRRPMDGQPALLLDGQTGTLRALMAVDDLNHWRTAAPVALAVRELAPDNATTLALLGAGAQARYQLRAIHHTVPSLESVRVFSRTPKNRQRFAEEMSTVLGLEVVAVNDPGQAARGADILCVTAPATVVEPSWVRPGALLTTILPGVVPAELGALLVVPSMSGPEVRSSGWDPRHGLSCPTACRDPEQIDLTLVDILRGAVDMRAEPRQSVAYEQLGVFGWDVPLIDWACRRGQEISQCTPCDLA